MEISPTSLFDLLRNMYEAVRWEESSSDYDSLLQKIFEEKATHDKSFFDSEMKYLHQNPHLPPEEVAGRDNEKQMLLSKLFDPNENGIQLSAIPIFGGDGSGKTTLAQLVYEDEMVKEHFELRAWVKVEGQELMLHHAALGLLKSVTGISFSLGDLDELDEMVRHTLCSFKCLVVFDGTEFIAEDSWLHMNEKWFNVVDLGSKVLITTPSLDVANLVANQPFELTQLSEEAAWSLCRYLAYDSLEGAVEMPSPPMDKNIAALCRGNPLSVKLVGSLMRSDQNLRNLLSFVDFSDSILLPPSDASLVTLLCIWALPPYLRQCFVFCSFFPKGYALNKKKIIDMWIADGLVYQYEELYSLDYYGDAYFHQLLHRSFFTDITYNKHGDITEVRMPGLIHKIAGDVARIIFNEKLGVIGSIGKDAAHLSFVSPLAKKSNSKHLRTLILSPTIYMGGSLEHSLMEFMDLQSLDLSCSGIRILSEEIWALKELRYLNLSYTLIERLPDSITNLSRLQTLDLSWCYHLKVLPEGMHKLTQMRHLDLSRCESLSNLPAGIGSLKALTLMPLFVLGKDHGCALLGDLRMLDKLSGRLEIRNLENVMDISEAREALIRKSLDHLGLSWSTIQTADDGFEILELLEPNQQLKVLDLTGYAGFMFPRWVSSLYNLIKISINDCGCKKLPSLGQLPFLEELQLKGMRNIEVIGPEFYGRGIAVVFPSLEKLGLYDLPMLLVWSGKTFPYVSDGSAQYLFPSLKTLTVEGCSKLVSLPSMPFLLDLVVCNSNSQILNSLTSFRSLSSILIKDMDLAMPLKRLHTLVSLKQLMLSNIKDLDVLEMVGFTVLEHLSILHCHQLNYMRLSGLACLLKLHIVDCRQIRQGIVPFDQELPLIELVVEDCPQLRAFAFKKFQHALRKLTSKSCPKFYVRSWEFKILKKLEYVYISGCPELERELEMKPSLTSHIPCVVLGNLKANKYKDYNDFKEHSGAPSSLSSTSLRNPFSSLSSTGL